MKSRKATPTATNVAPKRPIVVGDIIDRGDQYPGRCRVFAIHDFGTVDVERLKDGQCFRITGLSMV